MFLVVDRGSEENGMLPVVLDREAMVDGALRGCRKRGGKRSSTLRVTSSSSPSVRKTRLLHVSD